MLEKQPLRASLLELCIEFGELRIDGDSAFLIFKSTAIPNGFLPMAREDGEWKVAAIAGSSLQ